MMHGSSLNLCLRLACLSNAVHLAWGFATGAPASACLTMTPGHKTTSHQHGHPPFAVRVDSTSYRPNDRINVTLYVSCAEASAGFGGFLLQARRADIRENTEVQLGVFSVPVPAKSQMLNGCGIPYQAITHKNGTDLKKEMTFEWTAPQQPVGHVVMTVTFAETFERYWVKVHSEVIKDASLNTEAASDLTYPTPTSCEAPRPQQLAQLPLDGRCGNEKYCFYKCNQASCSYWVSWQKNPSTDMVDFEMASVVTESSNKWMAIGFSTDKFMGDELVVECLAFNNTMVVQTSNNAQGSKSNILNSEPDAPRGVTPRDRSMVDGIFRCSVSLEVGKDTYVDMAREWYMLFAMGDVDPTSGMKMRHSIEPDKLPGSTEDKILFIKTPSPPVNSSSMSNHIEWATIGGWILAATLTTGHLPWNSQTA